MKYLSIQQAAEQWAVSSRRVQQLCKSGEIDGAVKEGRSWRIPAQAQSPVRARAVERPHTLPLPVGTPAMWRRSRGITTSTRPC